MRGYLWGLGLTIGVGLLGALMVSTNPGPDEFEAYALEQMKTQLCKQVPAGFGKECPRFLEQNKVSVKEMIRENTQRRDYYFFSRYQTSLSLRSVLPQEIMPFLSLMPIPTGYDLETVGIFSNFYIYQAQSKQP
ncbi:MAG: DUF4359 domain-containing protein [Alkalinema sp. CAN_BIN05]|nr:DUF4359 domain-containing protein [Alkalinema sp. CAN_BIN05]